MQYDAKIAISTGFSRRAKFWKNKRILWSDLVKKLNSPVITGETYREYMHATKEDQGIIKDVGGYVGGHLLNGKRSPKNVTNRQLLTLDIDFGGIDFWDDFTMMYGNAAALHSTHKHSEDTPRFRLLIPLADEVTPEQYEAIARKIAGSLGIEIFDPTTFEVNRLMYWPSHSKDGDWFSETQDGPFLQPNEILNAYINWQDSTEWPTSKKLAERINGEINKQEDPETKRGVIGAFCRTYSLTDAIATFLPDNYEPTDIEDRYTYTKGSTSGGLIIYDNKFAYSHHGTDPISGQLCNAFDLVRIHLYGHLDNEGERGTTTKSYKSMESLILQDTAVKKTIANERLRGAADGYEAEDQDNDENVEQEHEVEIIGDWVSDLEIDRQGNYLSTAKNISIILANDPGLKKAFRLNEFDQRRNVFKSLPWRKIKGVDNLKNVDYSGLRNYIETVYGISSSLKIDDALALEFEKNTYHPIKEYLEGLEWDGTKRIDDLLPAYFGPERNVYIAEALRKMLVGAVARVYEPGKKFDLVLVLVGKEQGTGKSSFIKRLGGPWFSDTFFTISGKEALEQIQGAWIIEMAELSGLKKAEVETVKHFISKQEDSFRAAYARTQETYFRQCVFFGTTNKKDFLTDVTGNRRFMPVDVWDVKLVDNDELNAFLEDDLLLGQIWAEALYLYRNGETLYLSSEAEAIASNEQVNHSEKDDRAGIIENYLDLPLCDGWEELNILERREFIANPTKGGKHKKEVVCTAEIWIECLGKDKETMTRYNTREVNDILRSLPNWEAFNTTKNFSIYGKQKYYKRKK